MSSKYRIRKSFELDFLRCSLSAWSNTGDGVGGERLRSWAWTADKRSQGPRVNQSLYFLSQPVVAGPQEIAHDLDCRGRRSAAADCGKKKHDESAWRIFHVIDPHCAMSCNPNIGRWPPQSRGVVTTGMKLLASGSTFTVRVHSSARESTWKQFNSTMRVLHRRLRCWWIRNRAVPAF